MTTPAPRQMHLAAFAAAGPVSGSHGGWRHPDADIDLLSGAYYARLGRLLERGCFDLVFLADILAVPDTLRGSMDSQLRHGALGALRLEPLLVLATIAAATEHLGLACTVSTTYAEPFTLARAMATLDHLSGGRAAWNIVTSFQEAEARNFGLATHPERDERYDRADEFMAVACRLWASWDADALLRDAATPLFADPARVRRIDHEGTWFKVAGPLNVPRPPQGRPVFVQAGASDRGREFSARWAEVVFVTNPTPESTRAFRADVRARAEKLGRDPDQVKVLAGVAPLVAETRAAAAADRARLHALSTPEAGLSTLSYHLGVDLSMFPQDQVLPETMDVPGVEGHYREVAEMTRRSGLTLAELGRQYGAGRALPGFTGTGADVADTMQAWFESGACDGFMVQVPYLPGALDAFVRLCVPELQRRGLFRERYAGPMLRDQLGLKRPVD